MTPSALAGPKKENYHNVTFTWGDLNGTPSVAKFTDWAQDVDDFTALPAMEIDIPPNTGTFDNRPLVVTVPTSAHALFGDLAAMLPHSRVFVRVQEVTRSISGAAQASGLTLFNGRAERARNRANNKRGHMAIEVLSLKSRLLTPLGVPADHHCAFWLFGPGCRAGGLSQGPHDQPAVIDSLDGSIATVTSASVQTPTSPGGNTDRFWERGYVEYEGLRIGIRKWVLTDPTKFHLRRRPPASWVGPTLNFVPGCHGTIEDCRDVWDNEDSAGHYGYAIPPYHPMIES